MIEGRCGSCEFWKDAREMLHLEGTRGTCKSDDAIEACGWILPRRLFGCPFWQEKEPDLRELLAEHLFILCRGPIPNPELRLGWKELSEVKRKRMYAEADCVIALMKDAEDATSS